MQGAAAHYTALCRLPTGRMHLRPVQAAALHEVATIGGAFVAVRVGGGKTLLSLLIPFVTNAVRPVLLLPASLIKKTRLEMDTLMGHWRIPRNIQMVSYEMLGRESAAKFFENAQPDIIIADEAHKLKSLKAGVTRRVKRYMEACPGTRFVPMSGTLIKDSLEDFGHLLEWALKAAAPIPLDMGTRMEWSECLSPSDRSFNKIEPGPLLRLARPGKVYEGDQLSQARQVFRDRLLDTPGVISSGDDHVACSLYLHGLAYEVNQTTEDNFKRLRNLWETPDGWALTQAIDVWRHARELALGLHYIWDPRPPEEWINARRQWAAFVRAVISHSRTLDTELQIAHACAAGQLDATYWNAWASIRDTFTPNSKPVWHDDSALKVCYKWAKGGPGIVWTDHSFFARELARLTGWKYYGREGVTDQGEPIERADPTQVIIASTKANSTGRNLQAFNRNLLTAVPAGAPAWEQLLGRTHRDGQTADNVSCDFLIGCLEHEESFRGAVNDARMIQEMTGHTQKLLLSDIDMDAHSWNTPRWVANRKE